MGERIIIFSVRFYGISSNFIHLVCVNRITRNILFVTLARILRESAGTFPLSRISVPLLIAKVVQEVKPSQPTTMQPTFRPLCKNVALFSETIHLPNEIFQTLHENTFLPVSVILVEFPISVAWEFKDKLYLREILTHPLRNFDVFSDAVKADL